MAGEQFAEQQYAERFGVLPFGVEIVPPSGFDRGLGRGFVEYNGVDIMVHLLNNTWGNLQRIYGEEGERARALEDATKLQTHASAAARQYPYLFERIGVLAKTRQMMRGRLRENKLSPQEWEDWDDSHSEERKYLASEAFDALVPIFLEHGQNPVDIDT